MTDGKAKSFSDKKSPRADRGNRISGRASLRTRETIRRLVSRSRVIYSSREHERNDLSPSPFLSPASSFISFRTRGQGGNINQTFFADECQVEIDGVRDRAAADRTTIIAGRTSTRPDRDASVNAHVIARNTFPSEITEDSDTTHQYG